MTRRSYAEIDMMWNRISSLSTPADETDAATRSYVKGSGGMVTLTGSIASAATAQTRLNTVSGDAVAWGPDVTRTGAGLLINTAGTYRITVHGGFSSSGAGTIRMLLARLSTDTLPAGMNQIGGTAPAIAATSGNGLVLSGAGMWYLTAGQIVAAFARQDSGAALTCNATLEVEAIPGAPR